MGDIALRKSCNLLWGDGLLQDTSPENPPCLTLQAGFSVGSEGSKVEKLEKLYM